MSRSGEGLRVDAARASVYAPLVLAAAPHFLSQLDREPHSRSFGSFDRDHWAWKFRDFPILMMQWGVYPLALLYRLPLPGSPYRGSEPLLRWLCGALAELLRRQHSNGAWDALGPNNQDYGATLASVYYIVETASVLGDALSDELRSRVRSSVSRAVRFSATGGEDYAFISNHHGLYALGLRRAGDLLNEPSFLDRADALVREIVARQSADGFYLEYGGSDPGYESLAIQYLARYWQRTGDATLLESLRRAVSYFTYGVHLDGSIGGIYGTRATRLYFPAGFEILSGTLSDAAAVAEFMRPRLARCEVVTPANVDAHNAYVVLLSHLHACSVLDQPLPAALLPCEALRGERRFASGAVTIGTDRYHAVFAMHKGGVGRVHERSSGALVYEDAGWILRDEGGLHASQFLGSIRQETEHGVFSASGRMGHVRQEQLTPLRFLILRLLNFTVFRSRRLGDWIRRLVVERLITRVPLSPFSFARTIRWQEDALHFEEVLNASARRAVQRAEIARSFISFHMGSARYFHPSELAATPIADVSDAAESLNRHARARVAFTLRFGENEVSLERTPIDADSPWPQSLGHQGADVRGRSST